MILTWTDLQTFYATQIGDNSSNALTTGKLNMNIAYDELLKSNKWTFLESTKVIKTVAGQAIYELPNSVDKLMEGVKIFISSQYYPIIEIKSRDTWNALTLTANQSNIPEFYFISDNKIELYPVPNISDYNITLPYQTRVKKLSIEDVILSGNITLANEDKNVSSSVAIFTPQMVGRYIYFDETANGGDGMGYKIATYTDSTHIILEKPYEGASVTAQAITGKIGQCPIIPEGYQQIIVFKSIIMQNYQKDPNKYQIALAQFDRLYSDMKAYFQSKTTTTSYGKNPRNVNPNRFIYKTDGKL